MSASVLSKLWLGGLGLLSMVAGCRADGERETTVVRQALGSGAPLQETIGYRPDGVVTARSTEANGSALVGQTYTLSPSGRTTNEARTGGPTSTLRYDSDALGRLKCVASDATTICPTTATAALPSGVIGAAYYSGDKITNIRRRLAGGAVVNTRLEYDATAKNRPIRMVTSKGDCATSTCEAPLNFAYDPRGNRITETPSSGQGAGAVSRRFTYGPDNRVRIVRVATPEAPDADCTPGRWDQVDTDVGYDEIGTLAFRRRRLSGVTQQTVRYSRTPAGQVAYSLQSEGAAGTQRVTYKYLYLADERVVAVRETWQGGTRLTRTYLFFHSDRNGAPTSAFETDTVNGSGVVQWTADRETWGWTKITSSHPADEIPFEFPGQLRLDGTEVKRLVAGGGGCQTEVVQPAIVSNGFRDYDPAGGLYLSRDPLALITSRWALSAANRNLYGYAGFNPVDRVDYWGLETPGSSSETSDFLVSLIPVVGPGIGMSDAIVQGDWGIAVLNASFMFVDLASLGTAAILRGPALVAGEAIFRSGAEAVAKDVSAQAVKVETEQAVRLSCNPGPRSLGAAAAKRLPSNARTTTNAENVFSRLGENHGINRDLASNRLHEIKHATGRGGADNVIFDLSGGVYDEAGYFLGSLTEGGAKRVK